MKASFRILGRLASMIPDAPDRTVRSLTNTEAVYVLDNSRVSSTRSEVRGKLSNATYRMAYRSA